MALKQFAHQKAAGASRKAQFRTRVQASLTLTRSAVPHINKASELPRKTVSSPAPPCPLAYELLQGNLVRFSPDANTKDVPTAVLVHGILGSKRNLNSFARMIVEGFPTWQVLVVDLRCHGESAAAAGGHAAVGPHTVDSSARDVLNLLRALRMFPHMLVGHSFGGKVVMSMAHQFGARLPRPVQTWVLDTVPAEVPEGAGGGPAGAALDHPRALIEALQQLPEPIESRNWVLDTLLHQGFTKPVAQWVTTNLRPAPGTQQLRWTFDLDGIAEMYDSYEAASMWELLQQPPQGLSVDFVRAEQSSFRWEGGVVDNIEALGHRVHLLRDAGHVVHQDNPKGLFDIMSSSFGVVDLHLERAKAGTRRR